MTYSIKHGAAWVRWYRNGHLWFTEQAHHAAAFERYAEASVVSNSLQHLADEPLTVVTLWREVLENA